VWRIPAGFDNSGAFSVEDFKKRTRSDAKKFYDNVRNVVNRYGEPGDTDKKMLMLIEMQKEITSGMNGLEKEAFREELLNIIKADKGGKNSLSEAILGRITNGYGTPKQWMIAAISNSNMPKEDKDIAISYIEKELARGESLGTAFEEQNENSAEFYRDRVSRNKSGVDNAN